MIFSDEKNTKIYIKNKEYRFTVKSLVTQFKGDNLWIEDNFIGVVRNIYLLCIKTFKNAFS